jgi:hypothetical protein
MMSNAHSTLGCHRPVAELVVDTTHLTPQGTAQSILDRTPISLAHSE